MLEGDGGFAPLFGGDEFAGLAGEGVVVGRVGAGDGCRGCEGEDGGVVGVGGFGGLGPVEAGGEVGGAFAGEGGEVGFEFVEGGGVAGDGGVDGDAFGEVGEDAFEGIEAEFADEEFDDEGGLVVGEVEVERGFGGHEGGAEVADGGEFVVVEDHGAVAGVHGLAPGGVGLAFLEDGDAFAEPAGHFVFGELEGDDVTEFVPEDGLPVGGMGGLGGGAVGGDDGAEADAEVAGVAGHAEGADGEVLLVGEDFDGDGLFELEAVFGGKGGVGAFEEFEGGAAVDAGFAGAHAEDEVLVGEGLEFAHRVLEVDEVEGGNVVGILLIDFVGELPAFGFLAEAEQVLGKLDFGGEVVGIELEGLALGGGAFGEAVFEGEFLADKVFDVGVGGPGLAGVLAGGGFGSGVGAEVGDDGAAGPGFGVAGVYLVDEVENFLGFLVFLGVDQVVGEEEAAGDVVGVEFEGGIEGEDHGTAFAGGEGAGEAVVELGVFGEAFEAVAEGFGGEVEVVFGECEFAGGEVGVAKGGVGEAGLVVEFFEDLLGVNAEEQGGATEDDHVGGVAVGPAAVGDEFVDFAEHFAGALGLVVELVNVVTGEAEADAGVVAGEGVGEGGEGISVAAEGEEGVDFQFAPFLGVFVVGDGLVGEGVAFGVFAGKEEFAAGVEVGGGGGGGKESEQDEECGGGQEQPGLVGMDVAGWHDAVIGWRAERVGWVCGR